MEKIKKIKNWFLINRVSNDAKVQSSTFRKINRDVLMSIYQLKQIIDGTTIIKKNQFVAHKHRIELMLGMTQHADELLIQLAKAGSVHNTFRVRWRVEKLQEFLVKYLELLSNYNPNFLEKVHYAVELKVSNGIIVEDNLYYTMEGNIEIRKS